MNYLQLYESFILERSKNDPIQEIYKQKKLAVFLIGHPAAGKSTIKYNDILRKNSHFNSIDPDEKSKVLTKHLSKVKTSFKDRVSYKKYKNIITNRVEIFPRIRGLNKNLEAQFEVALHEGTNIIYDSTGNNKKLLTYFIDKCNEFEYEIVFIHVMGKNLDWSLKQSDIRAATTGRPVDKEYIAQSYKDNQKLIKYYSNLDIDAYYIIWNRGKDERPKYYKYEDGILLKRAGSEYKPASSVYRRMIKEDAANVKALHAFDMDGTLLKSPKFSDFYSNGELPNSETDMGRIIDKELKDHNLSREDVEIIDDRITVPFDKGPDDWEKLKGRKVMPKPHDYYSTKESLGHKTYENVKSIYDNVEDKCIITGRAESLKDKVVENLESVGIEMPNKGLYLAPNEVVEGDDIAEWKASVLAELSKGYDVVYFYEDKLSWIEAVECNWSNMISDKDVEDNLIILHVKNGEIVGQY